MNHTGKGNVKLAAGGLLIGSLIQESGDPCT